MTNETEEAAKAAAGAEPAVEHHEERPRGTALIVTAFLVATAAVWAWAYYLLVSWGN